MKLAAIPPTHQRSTARTAALVAAGFAAFGAVVPLLLSQTWALQVSICATGVATLLMGWFGHATTTLTRTLQRVVLLAGVGILVMTLPQLVALALA